MRTVSYALVPRRRFPVRAIARRPMAFYDITGSIGQTPRRGLGPRVIVPFQLPGLGSMWEDHLDQQQLGGLFKKLKKTVKKVVKSKAFKYAAVATAAYFTAGAALKYAPQIMASGKKVVGLAKAVIGSKVVPTQAGSVAAQPPPVVVGYTAQGAPVYDYEEPSYTIPTAVYSPAEQPGTTPTLYPTAVLPAETAAPATAGMGQTGKVLAVAAMIAGGLAVLSRGGGGGGRRRRRGRR